MTQLELASRAAAGALGMNPATEWEKARPVAEAVLAAVVEHSSNLIFAGVTKDGEIVSQGQVAAAMERLDEVPFGERTPAGYGGEPLGLTVGKETSAEIATIAARLMNHEDPDVRRVAASALVQR